MFTALFRRSPGNWYGFTLLELMVVLAIAAILLVVGVPNFVQLIKNNRLTAQVNGLGASLNLARSEAVKRHQPVALCQSSNGSSCTASWSSSNLGWMVFVDGNGNNAWDNQEEVLRVSASLSGGNTLRYTRSVLAFSPQGDVQAPGTFVLCDDRGAGQARGLIVLASGLVRLAVDNNADGTVEDASGNNIRCP